MIPIFKVADGKVLCILENETEGLKSWYLKNNKLVIKVVDGCAALG